MTKEADWVVGIGLLYSQPRVDYYCILLYVIGNSVYSISTMGEVYYISISVIKSLFVAICFFQADDVTDSGRAKRSGRINVVAGRVKQK